MEKKGKFLKNGEKGDLIMVPQSGHPTDPADGKTFAPYSVWRPAGARMSYIREQEVNERYRPVRASAAQSWWAEQYAVVPEIETKEVHIIAGAIIPLWQKLKSKAEAKLQVVRVSTEDGQRIVGVEIPRLRIGPVLRSLGLGRFAADPSKVFRGVLHEGDEITLVGDLKLKRSHLQREPVIELLCVDCDRFEELRRLGLINEQISFRQRFFVPADEGKGVRIITELLKRYPIDEPNGASEDPQQSSLSAHIPIPALRVVHLEDWILPPEEDVARSAASPMLERQMSFMEAPTQVASAVEPPSTYDEVATVSLASLMEERRRLQRRPRKRPVIPEQGLLSW